MGRELRRKQAKKEGKSLQPEIKEEEKLIKKLIIITAILVFIICTIYVLSALFITKELDWLDKKDEDVTDNLIENTILASEIFKQKEEEYYVYFYDYTEKNNQITSTVESKLSTKKVYKVDTSSALNNKYVSDQSNKSAKKIEELKVKAPTVIKINGDQISEYYEDNEIINDLK